MATSKTDQENPWKVFYPQIKWGIAFLMIVIATVAWKDAPEAFGKSNTFSYENELPLSLGFALWATTITVIIRWWYLRKYHGPSATEERFLDILKPSISAFFITATVFLSANIMGFVIFGNSAFFNIVLRSGKYAGYAISGTMIVAPILVVVVKKMISYGEGAVDDMRSNGIPVWMKIAIPVIIIFTAAFISAYYGK